MLSFAKSFLVFKRGNDNNGGLSEKKVTCTMINRDGNTGNSK